MHDSRFRRTVAVTSIATAAVATFTLAGLQAASAAPAPAYYNATCAASTVAVWSHAPHHVTQISITWYESATGPYLDGFFAKPKGHSVSAPTPTTAGLAVVNWYSRTTGSFHSETVACS